MMSMTCCRSNQGSSLRLRFWSAWLAMLVILSPAATKAQLISLTDPMSTQHAPYSAENVAQLNRLSHVYDKSWMTLAQHCSFASSCKVRLTEETAGPLFQNTMAVSIICNNFVRSYRDTNESLSKFNEEIRKPCNLVDKFRFMQNASVRGSNLAKNIQKLEDLFETAFARNFVATFEKTLLTGFPAYFARQSSAGNARFVYSFWVREKSGHTIPDQVQLSESMTRYLNEMDKQDPNRAGREANNQRLRAEAIAKASKAAKRCSILLDRNCKSTANPRNAAEAFAMLLGSAFSDTGLADFQKNFEALAAENSKPLTLVPGKIMYKGIVFGQDREGEAVNRYDKFVRENSQFALGSTNGIIAANSIKTSRDGKVTIHCWNWYARYRSINSPASTCLYAKDGLIVGGQWNHNDEDPVDGRYLAQQKFKLSTELGQSDLGYAAKNARLLSGDTHANITTFDVSWDYTGQDDRPGDRVSFKEEVCFYPESISASLTNAQKCIFLPR